MSSTKALCCKKIVCKKREAYLLSDDVVSLTALTGGGHIAEFHLKNPDGTESVSPLRGPRFPPAAQRFTFSLQSAVELPLLP